MTDNFEQYAEKGNIFLKRLAEALGNPEDKAHAFRVTTALLHTIRGRIQPEQSMHLISQLPMAIKGLYVDGWKINREPNNSKTVKEFLDEIRENCPRTAGRDFGNDQQTLETVTAFFTALKEYVDEGELKDIRAQLPSDIAILTE